MNAPSYPRRPRRLDRLFASTRAFYFVTFNTHDRAKLLAGEAIHAAFRDFAMGATKRGVSVGRYVIMPDHIHLFVSMDRSNVTLSAWMKALKSVLGRTLTAHGHSLPHWQQGFFDHVMRSADSYSQKWDYVRNNPVRAGLCADPESWPYQGEIVRLQF